MQRLEKVDRNFEAKLRAGNLSTNDVQKIFGPTSNVPDKADWTNPIIVRLKRSGIEKTHVEGARAATTGFKGRVRSGQSGIWVTCCMAAYGKSLAM
jgi:hypothetical protein